MIRVSLYAVAGREAAGRRPAGVHQQGVSDRGDVRGGQEHPDPHQAQVANTRSVGRYDLVKVLCGLCCGLQIQKIFIFVEFYGKTCKCGVTVEHKTTLSSCRPDPTVEIAFIRRRSSSSSSSGPHSPIGLQATSPAQAKPAGLGAAAAQPAVVTRITASRNPASDTLPTVNISQVCVGVAAETDKRRQIKSPRGRASPHNPHGACLCAGARASSQSGAEQGLLLSTRGRHPPWYEAHFIPSACHVPLQYRQLLS